MAHFVLMSADGNVLNIDDALDAASAYLSGFAQGIFPEFNEVSSSCNEQRSDMEHPRSLVRRQLV